MKTLIKNQHCYGSQIGTFDEEQEIKKEENQDEESDHEGRSGDDSGEGQGCGCLSPERIAGSDDAEVQ